jgi:hypothetical protein
MYVNTVVQHQSKMEELTGKISMFGTLWEVASLVFVGDPVASKNWEDVKMPSWTTGARSMPVPKSR